jgi:hypothetical protein
MENLMAFVMAARTGGKWIIQIYLQLVADFWAQFSLDVMHIDYRSVTIGVLAFSVFTYEGFRQMYRAKHVDKLEREGKIPADVAARIRKKPMKLIGWSCICVGIVFLLQGIFSWP